MAAYSVFGTKGTTSVRAILTAVSTITLPRRVTVYDYMVGAFTAPADAVFEQNLVRVTSDGTATTVTPSPLDTADPVAQATGNELTTIEPTIGVNLMQVSLNHRATYRWVAAPGSELISPATDNNGIGGAIQTAAVTDFTATILFRE